MSGANCSLILGALLLAARSLRLARLPAAAVALAGLGLFVLMVGPDASVLRASLMGAIALASVAGGRAGRGLSFLCLAVIALLLSDPALGTSFGFLLSVLATLGIIVLGRRIMDWIPPAVPRWAAAGIAVPLSAQLLRAQCGLPGRKRGSPGRGYTRRFPGSFTASLSQIGRGRCLHVVGPRTDPQEES